MVGFRGPKDSKAINNHADAALLTRLRAGHTTLLEACANLLDPSAGPLCPLCKEEPQTVEPWLRRCPRLDAVAFKVLTTDLERKLKLTRAQASRTTMNVE